MAFEIYYGKPEPLVLEFRDDLRVTDFGVPRGEPLTDVQQAVQAALHSPLDFPPVQAAIVAGDHVVVPVAAGVPQAPAVVAGVVRSLVDGGTALKDVTLLVEGKAKPATSEIEEPLSPLVGDLPEAWRAEIQVTTHDPTAMVALAYLAASKEAEPIYVNRLLSDADVVLPIGVVQPPSISHLPGPFDGLFPAFSDEETQRRLRNSEDTPRLLARRRRDAANEVGWWLGVQCAVQVVPGAGDAVLKVLAGNCEAVFHEGRHWAQSAWQVHATETADVVVASIAGGADQQTWENLARALDAAALLVREQGVIVLCTSLRGKAGPGLKRLSNWTPGDPVPAALRRERTPDVLAALALVNARQRARVYLLSRLKSDVVEDWGIGCVTSADEIVRLTKKQETCILLSNAQHAEVIVDGE